MPNISTTNTNSIYKYNTTITLAFDEENPRKKYMGVLRIKATIYSPDFLLFSDAQSFQMESYGFMDISIVHIRNLLVPFTSLHLFPKAPVGSWK